MSKKRSFIEVGEWLQTTAKTAEDAKERFDSSCTRCNKQAVCKEQLCPIYKAHQTRLLILETNQQSRPVVYITTRKYKKATLEVKMKKRLLNFLTRLANTTTNRKLELILDDVSVRVELQEYALGLYILESKKLVKTAARYKAIMQEYNWEV